MSAATIAPRLDHLTQTPALQRRTTGPPPNGLASLVNKLPVVYTLQSERYHLLETIRAFAWTRLDLAGDADQAALLHTRLVGSPCRAVWARRRWMPRLVTLNSYNAWHGYYDQRVVLPPRTDQSARPTCATAGASRPAVRSASSISATRPWWYQGGITVARQELRREFGIVMRTGSQRSTIRILLINSSRCLYPPAGHRRRPAADRGAASRPSQRAECSPVHHRLLVLPDMPCSCARSRRPPIRAVPTVGKEEQQRAILSLLQLRNDVLLPDPRPTAPRMARSRSVIVA